MAIGVFGKVGKVSCPGMKNSLSVYENGIAFNSAKGFYVMVVFQMAIYKN
jgi:hypothetical protein